MHLIPADGKTPAHRLFHRDCQAGVHGELPRLPHEPKEAPPMRTVRGRDEEGSLVTFPTGRESTPAEERAVGWALARSAAGWPVATKPPAKSVCGICGAALSGELIGLPISVGPQV